MTQPRTDPLPPEVRRTLAAEGDVPAGEELVRFAERMARSRPGEARRWGARLASSRFDSDVITGCARWAAGVAMYLSGDVNGAEPCLREAARRLSGAANEGLADRARLLLVDLHGERFELGRARRLATRLQRSFAARGDHERAAVAQINLACAEDTADRVARARDLWLGARSDLAQGSLRRLLTDGNLANVAALEGRFDDAAAGLRRVADEARSEGLQGLVAQAELNLAEVEFAAGRVDAAFARWQRVIAGAAADGNASIEVAAEIDFAAAEAAIGDIGGARTRLDGALARARELGLDGEVIRGVRLAAVLEAADGEVGSWRDAMQELAGPDCAVQRDLLLVEISGLDPSIPPGRLCRASRRLIRSGHRQRGRLGLAWAARRYFERGERARARAVAEEVLEARRLSPWIRMLAHHVLGRLGGAQGVRKLLLAARYADDVHGRLAAAGDRQAFLSVRGDVYLDLLTALLDRNRPSDRKRALDVAVRLRSGWLLDELARRSDRGDDESATRWQELRCRLAALLEEMEGGEEPRVRRSGLKLDGVIREIERDLRAAENELARRWPLAGARTAGSAADSLLEVLPKNDIFVEYLFDRDDLVVFCAHNGTLAVTNVAGGAVRLRDLLASVQFHLDANIWLGDGAHAAQDAALDERLQRLDELLLDQVPLEGVSRLWIAPHADLFHVPWAALHSGSAAFLVDRVPFTLVPGAEAATMLLREPSRWPRSTAIGGTAAPTLPMVAREVREVAAIHAGAVLTEATTRKEFLHLLAEHELVHLAGHAVFLDGLPFASGLRMSDGYVTVHDLAATRLRARLVSFGVCSGLRLGRDASAGDRWAGFVLALMSGGVRTVVGPVAAVRDDVAYRFDVVLHEQIRDTGDVGRAFRTAVRAVRELDQRPATWGSFQLYGDSRPWEKT